ncbi:MAG: MarR family winged helix-turn-helix transcriptional regulator [Bacillota bacterium]
MDTNMLLELRTNIQKFIRIFGLLEQNVTPCGFPLSVSQVFSLQELENTSMSITELAQELHLERSSVSRLVDGMVKEGFIRRDINEFNRREMVLSLTEKGTRTLNQVREQSIKFYQDILGDVSDNDQTLIIEAFRKLTVALIKKRGEQDG